MTTRASPHNVTHPDTPTDPYEFTTGGFYLIERAGHYHNELIFYAEGDTCTPREALLHGIAYLPGENDEHEAVEVGQIIRVTGPFALGGSNAVTTVVTQQELDEEEEL